MLNWSKAAFETDMSGTTGPYNGDPGTQAQLEIGILDTRGGSTAVNVNANVRITYYSTLYERKQLAQS